ncbi:MAG: ATP-binding protein [Rhodothermaceae bacterium]
MAVRQMIEINEELCTGCGDCIPGCPEGALQIIDGKARLISDLFCDGLGACLGTCPVGAIKTIEREAEPYDEKRVMEENIIPAGENTIKAHLKHLKDHNQTEFLNIALGTLKERGIEVNLEDKKHHHHHGGGGCPGSQSFSFGEEKPQETVSDAGVRPSQLTHWPVQLHLVSPVAPHFQGSDVLLAADCCAFAHGDFHKDYLKDRTLAIACPKLDSGQEVYIEKVKAMIDQAKINTLTVMIMQVPCCGGLLRLAQQAVMEAERKIPLKVVVVGIDGGILKEEWV